ncbi:MAG: ABC transporter substrate-binding protein [Desulfobulbaceae bacterium]|uniref:ABC transporter substrate-binding protein n=1 Tax=Candidatus Desulfobia pelagia TaxID=2841692 RepID=A0A8J6NAZ1_9BACT|nr:ABC transporter substrate-binding protein [Candidatus Desulfobia pelagia]
MTAKLNEEKKYLMHDNYIRRVKKSSATRLRWPLFTLISSLLFLFFLQETVMASDEDAMQPIEASVEEILFVLNSNKETEWNKTRQKISIIIQKRFDFQEQSRLVLASHWEEITTEEKTQFISLFSTLQEHVYLNRLRDYSDEKVHFTKQIIKEDKAVVFSAIVKDTEEIPIVYRMKKKQNQWFVYDVIIDGVSLVKNYRKQFSSILEKEKFPGLIEKMEEKIEQITAAEEKT